MSIFAFEDNLVMSDKEFELICYFSTVDSDMVFSVHSTVRMCAGEMKIKSVKN